VIVDVDLPSVALPFTIPFPFPRKVFDGELPPFPSVDPDPKSVAIFEPVFAA
jgi:hypothetical protein